MKKIIEHTCYTLWIGSLITYIAISESIGSGSISINKLFPVIILLIIISAAAYGLWIVSEQE